MKRLHSEAVAPEKQAAFQRAISTKNPLALQSFEERGASIAAKVSRIQNNPNYKKMTPEQQFRIRSNMYDKYVKPSYEGFHLEVPNKESWLRLTSKEDKLGTQTGANSFFENKNEQGRNSFIFGLDKGLTGIGLFGLRISNKHFQALHKIENSFSAYLPASFKEHIVNTNAETDKTMQRLINLEKNHLTDSDVWLKSHYRDSSLNSLMSGSGELISTLPLYEAIGGFIGGAAEGAGIGASAFGPLAKSASLTQKLARTTLGKWTANTLTKGVDGYLSSLVVSGGDKKEAKSNAIGMAVLPTFGLYGGAVEKDITKRLETLASGEGAKWASFPLIKKWSASVLAMAGKPFAQDLAASALHEETIFEEHLAQTEHSSAPVNLGRGIVIKPSSEGKGYINFEGVDHPYRSKVEKEELHNKITEYIEKNRLEKDPVMAQLHHAEKITQGSIAQQLYGKPLRQLSSGQRDRVLKTRLTLINQAAEEAPVHLPELAQAEVEHDISEELKTNPARAERHKLYEKEFGEPVAKAVAKENVKKVALETGIINPKATIEKLDKPIPARVRKAANKAIAAGRSIENAEYEPPDGSKVSFDAFRKDAMVYLRKGESNGRLAADGTKVGARDKRTWNEILKSDNLKGFIEVLKEADGNRIKFQNPLHRMLFHYSNREGLPQPVKDKLVREIRKAVLGNKKIAEKWTTAQIAAAADNTALHLYELSKSGRLGSGESMYASTNVNPNWSPTQWQMQLHNENDDEQLKLVADAMKRHPEQLKDIQAGMKTLMGMKYESESLDKYLELDAEIRKIALESSSGIVGLGKKGGK